jgi:hypothetical protein
VSVTATATRKPELGEMLHLLLRQRSVEMSDGDRPRVQQLNVVMVLDGKLSGSATSHNIPTASIASKRES